MQITILERFVIESLNERPKSFEELLKDSKMEMKTLINILNDLKEKNVIYFQDLKYQINFHDTSIIHLLKDKENLKEEILELFSSVINRHLENNLQTRLSIKKISLDDYENKIFQSLIYNIDSFLQNIEKKNKSLSDQEKNNLPPKKVIFWGHSPYHDLVQQTIKSLSA